MSEHRNVFSEMSDEYAGSRPVYPEELFEWVVSLCSNRQQVWDCATGSGQGAVGLAPFFETVHATDISEEQIRHGVQVDNVQYSVQAAEKTDLPEGTIDLVVVAQALHWFDFPKFWKEVRRVANEEAFFCAWAYAWFETTAKIDQGLVDPFRNLLEPYWADNNRIMWEGYQDRDILFPFERIAGPDISIVMNWRMDQLLAYLSTWSAYRRSQGTESVRRQTDDLFRHARGLVDPDEVLRIEMPLIVLAGRVN